jgi:biotin carboxylase
VIFIEEPDVARKRDVAVKVSGSPLTRELIEWEYQLPGAADTLFNARPDLDPAVVVPLVEYATPFAARLAERFSLPGAGVGAAEIMRDKSLLRKVTGAAGIANPDSAPARSPEDVLRFMTVHTGPVVLKPADRQGTFATLVIHDRRDIKRAWFDCLMQDEGVLVPDRRLPLRMLVEQFVHGREYSVEMLVREGIPLFTNVTDKTLYPGRRPIELGHVVPAAITDQLRALLHDRTSDVLRAVGFGTGIVHCEWIVSAGKPYLVECAGRLPSDNIPELIERAYSIPLGTSYLALMCGHEVPQLPSKAVQAAAVRYAQVSPGDVLGIDGLAAAAAIPGVASCSVTVGIGDTVGELRSSWDRVGSAIAVAATPGEAARLAEKAIEQLTVVVG